MYTFSDITNKIEESGRAYDADRIKMAHDMAEGAHQGQCRKSGEPYISHPIAVSIILIELGMDTDSIVAALLHDVVEDTEIPIETIEKKFGNDVALLVDGVTKLGKIPYSSREEQQAENVRKMLLAMAQDVRVIIIKLADRLHNMRTLDAMSEQKQRDKARETMEVYAPLAHRLGIRAIKEELEDLSLKFLDSVAYKEVDGQLALRKDDREKFLAHIKEKIKTRIEQENQTAHIDGRVKSIYGIYRKVYLQGRAFDEIFDVYAVRIIVDSVNECYNILGIIHDMFRPIPNRFKDYISTAKHNMYQSLHTTVFDKEGVPFEVQIRTWDMHHTAEYGIAAHWKYKVGITGKDKLEERLAWVRQLLEAQKETEDVEEIVRSIKTDIAPEEVFVFTPKGDVIRLPVGSNVIDFAYAIHSAVGNRMIGAKVDGRMVSLDYVVKTGMIVEVMTSSKSNGPNRDWIKMVKTSEAKNKIRSWFKKEKREENIAEGKNELEKEFKRNLITLSEPQLSEFIFEIAKRQRFNTIPDFMAAVGYGGVSLSRIMPRIKEEYIRIYRTSDEAKAEKVLTKPKKEKKSSSGVIVEGLDGCLVKFAKCCNPLPGDNIIGFVTRGYGVSVHKIDCVNVGASINDENQKDRWIHTEWAKTAIKETFKSSIDILSDDNTGILANVSITLNNMHIQIHSLIAKELKGGQIGIQITVGISDLEQLKAIISSIRKIDGVISVERLVQ